MTENTNAGIRHRAACDRCSAQKLRCPRRSGLEACERCAKGHHPCVYSPFRPKAHSKDRDDSSRRVPMLRDEILSSVEKQVAPAPKRKRTASATGSLPDNLRLSPTAEEVGIEWMSNEVLHFGSEFEDFDFGTDGDAILNDMLNPSSNSPDLHGCEIENLPSFDMDNDRFHQIPRQPSPGFHAEVLRGIASPSNSSNPKVNLPPREHSLPLNDCIHQLSCLSAGLYQLRTAIPPTSIHDQSLSDGAVSMGDYSNFSIDEIFELSQKLVDIYPKFIDTFVRRKPVEDTTEPSLELISRSPSPTIDHASIFLILSCHMRLIDIYEELFKHITLCIQIIDQPFNPVHATLRLPQVKIGSYNPPRVTAVRMQILLFIHLGSQLSELATELVSQMQKEAEELKSSKSGPPTLSLVTAQTVKSKADNIAHELIRIKSTVLEAALLS